MKKGIIVGLVALLLLPGCGWRRRAKAKEPVGKPKAAAKPKTADKSAVPAVPSAAPSTPRRPTPSPGRRTLDYSHFLERLIDLDGLPSIEEGVTCKQASSYDRRSHDPKQWQANGDCGNYIRVDSETGEAVMADLKGPGCIFRIWSANPQGKIRFYLDGDTKPTYEFSFNDLFLGKVFPFKKPLVYKRDPDNYRSASDCYVPIPYAKSCRVAADKRHGQYYIIGYKTYPPGTDVATFRLPLTESEKQTLQKVMDRWEHCGEDPAPKPAAQTLTKTVTVAPGERAVLADLPGSAVVQSIKVKLKSPERYALRKWAVQAFWDGETNPSVDAPLGDFFGTGWQENLFRSFPLGMTEEGGYSYWRMPFHQAGRIEVINEGVKPGRLWYEVKYVQTPLPSDTLYFFAKFRRESPSRVFDYPFLQTEGKGRFVGMNLSIDNPGGGWWGEGDEKAWVDGEAFPSSYGTGSEDYFGDAWGIRRLVQPYFACSFADGRRTSCYRWHISDSIPFNTSFKMTIENYDPDSDDDDYCTVAYWYALKGQKDFFRHCSASERRPWGKAINHALQAEREFVGKTIDDVDLPYELSGGHAVDLGTKKPGDRLSVTGLKASRDHVYTFGVATIQDPKLAKFDVLLNGKKIGSTPEKYDGRKTTYDLARAKLPQGDVPLSLRFTSPGRAVFDCFYLRPAATGRDRVEAERCQIKTSGPKIRKEYATLDWSDGCQVVFPAAKVLDRVELASGVSWRHPGGDYMLLADVTCGPDYGNFQVLVDGRPVGPVVSCYSPKSELRKRVRLGDVKVARRRFSVALSVVGKDAKSKGYKIGLDCFTLARPIAKGAIEGETAKVVEAKGPTPRTQKLGSKWSLGEQLFFTPRKVGSYVVLETHVRRGGRYALDVYFTKSFDYGIVQVSVDGKKVGTPIDTYCPRVDHMGRVPISTVSLNMGAHKIKFEVVGKNKKSKGYFMGIDCFTLTKAD